ncbi:uncharacterized protein BCR38DRAFT_429932 [Pseudomassariella vexata]|uniref:Uncharacterized protein n=1 Tax=Pseudomassariella vexata TaxID=1141098 RepID=A0A1Y2E638_9PEZI|nr:uncharacterized protein BCR38DRAFT_429932 [Pseudomassariella vexata]ORY66335.1 hypothetical protein BCR38DRAFT_429932 [Pseudomassariella vexata]
MRLPSLQSRSKPRLYLALYSRLKHPNSYHYALHILLKYPSMGAVPTDGSKNHCKNIMQAAADGQTISIPWGLQVNSSWPVWRR